MTPRKIAALVGGGVVLLIIVLIVWDILVITDEERIEEFADAVTEQINDENIKTALTYTDPAVQPILVEIRGESMRFNQSGAVFGSMARTRLRPFEGTAQHVLRKSIEMGENKANVSTETFSRQGRVSVDWELRKRDERWLVSRMSIHR
jgi:hypothetical protein